MAVLIEVEEIRSRVAERRQQESVGVDLWVSLASCGRQEAAAAIEGAVLGLVENSTGWWVCPTTGGTYVWLDDAASWEVQVQRLAADLEALGHKDGVISAAPVDAWFSAMSDRPYPSVVMAHRMDPPLADGPFNAMGMPVFRWGVPQKPNEKLLTRAATWVCRSGTQPQVGEIAFIPVTVNDAPEVLKRVLDRGSRRVQLLSRDEDVVQEMRRVVMFETWGRSAWSDLDPNAAPVDLAEGLADQLADFAEDLDTGVVHPAFPGEDEINRMATPLWNLNRHLWSEFAPDAFGIQVLTGRQLRRAHDLTNWSVSEVADDRWLVRARDLSPWFDVPDARRLRDHSFPDEEVRRQARADFGDLILRESSAAANPRPRPD